MKYHELIDKFIYMDRTTEFNEKDLCSMDEIIKVWLEKKANAIDIIWTQNALEPLELPKDCAKRILGVAKEEETWPHITVKNMEPIACPQCGLKATVAKEKGKIEEISEIETILGQTAEPMHMHLYCKVLANKLNEIIKVLNERERE